MTLDAPTTDAVQEPDRDWGGYWLGELSRSRKAMADWRKRARDIIAKYRQCKADGVNNWARPFPLLWANIETQKEAIYSRPPNSVVTRRNRKQNPVARVASEVLESGINYVIGASDLDGALKRCRDDFLLIARGQAWVRYEFDRSAEPMPVGIDEMGQPIIQPVERITDERAMVDYVHWGDFLHDMARTWKEVGWVARQTFKTKDEIGERFGPEVAGKIAYDHCREDKNEKGDSDAGRESEAKARIWEIWSRTHNKVFFVAESYDDPAVGSLLDATEPLFDFDGFFPCPEPIYGTLTNDDLIPTPDYVMYQDQDQQINDLTRKVHELIKALKVIGFTPGADGDSGIAQLKNAMTKEEALQIIAVPSWATFTERGGGNQIVWLPLREIVASIDFGFKAIEALKQQVYEISGTSDVMRGSTDPNETLGAQELKSQWGSVRIRPRQANMARFARDLCRLIGEVVAEAFQPETLAKMTEAEVTPEVVALLRDGAQRNFIIDVETDSTIQPNEDAEKQRRIEFGNMMSEILPVAQESIQRAPVLAPMIGEMIKFIVRGFRAGREMEEVIEKTMDQVTQQAMQPKPPQPDPAMAKVQAEAETDKARLEMEGQLQMRKQDMDFEAKTREQAMKATMQPPVRTVQ